MAQNHQPPLTDLSSCNNVPEYHESVEPMQGGELRPGFLLDGRFLLEKPLSRSGMALIYKAQDTRNDNQTVAVKVPHMKCESDPLFFTRFQRENDIGLQLNHPFLLKFVRVEEKSRPYIVTEYLSGCTLFHLLQAMRPLPEKDALKIGSLLCEALQHMHDRGVTHRDLKPSNIMICRDKTIRLMDFGIASSASLRKVTLAAFAPAMGTPDYMSPEQVMTKACDGRTDIYSLGVILYELLTGQVPFQHEDSFVAMNNRVSGDPPALRKINPTISPQAEEIVLHAMQRDPNARYPSASAMKAELDAPENVRMTHYCERLQEPRWRLGMRETPILAGTLIGVGFVSVQALLFLILRHLLAR